MKGFNDLAKMVAGNNTDKCIDCPETAYVTPAICSPFSITQKKLNNESLLMKRGKIRSAMKIANPDQKIDVTGMACYTCNKSTASASRVFENQASDEAIREVVGKIPELQFWLDRVQK